VLMISHVRNSHAAAPLPNDVRPADRGRGRCDRPEAAVLNASGLCRAFDAQQQTPAFLIRCRPDDQLACTR
jgi:hypothetical protein